MSDGFLLRDLTIPGPDTGTVRHVHGTHGRLLVRDFLSLPTLHLTPGRRALHERTVELVQELLGRDRWRAVRALRRPTVQALTGAARRHAGPAGRHADLNRWVHELDLVVLLELAAHGELAAPVEVRRDGPWPALHSPGANLLARPSPAAEALVFSPGRLVARNATGSQELRLSAPSPIDGPLLDAVAPYHEITDGILLATSDNNPLADVQAHPERAGNRLDLGGRPVAEWLSGLRAAFALVDEHLPLVAEEMRLMLELVVPVGHHDERHFSCSFEEAVGAVYLTLHPSPMTLAEALVHEFQHNKLNAVFRFDPVLHDAHAPVHRSPVRPDPRPLHGVLMAVHAFQPVARLYENMTAAGHPLAKGRDWPRRFRDILRINREGMRTLLDHGRPTPLGEGLVRELRALDDHFRSYELLHWPARAVGSA